jgi:hypothetical protein
MVGALFQGSNDMSAWTTLVQVTSQPPEGVYTTLQVSNTTVWRYVRYVSPDNGFCNVAEVEFYSNGQKQTGAPFGSPGSYGGSSSTFDKALDGDTTTYFDANEANGDFVGLDLGAGGTTAGPSIGTQPVSQTKSVGDSVTFSVTATGTSPVAYQWRKDTVAISGNASAQTATLTLNALTSIDDGSYDVIVSDPTGQVISSAVTLTVQKTGAQITLSNLSQAYNAAPRIVTATTVPAGLNLDITYNGGSNVPVLPGNYTVVATVDDPDFSGTANGILTVTGAAVALRATNTPTVSINFVGGYPGNTPMTLASGDVAGAVAASHWNNASGATGQGTALIDQAGAATGAVLAWNAAGGTWLTGIGNGTSDTKLMAGYLDAAEGQTSTVTVSNLPSSLIAYGYDVYVYTDGQNGAAQRVAKYSVGSSTFTSTDSAQTDFNGSYIQAANSAGNFVRFANLTANTFTLSATPVSSTDQFQRAPINGIQIVAHAPLHLTQSGYTLNRRTGHIVQQVTVTNGSSQTVVGPIYLVIDGLSSNTSVTNANGVSLSSPPFGDAYIEVSSMNLAAGQSASATIEFANPASGGITYSPRTVIGPAAP